MVRALSKMSLEAEGIHGSGWIRETREDAIFPGRGLVVGRGRDSGTGGKRAEPRRA